MMIFILCIDLLLSNTFVPLQCAKENKGSACLWMHSTILQLVTKLKTDKLIPDQKRTNCTTSFSIISWFNLKMNIHCWDLAATHLSTILGFMPDWLWSRLSATGRPPCSCICKFENKWSIFRFFCLKHFGLVMVQTSYQPTHGPHMLLHRSPAWRSPMLFQCSNQSRSQISPAAATQNPQPMTTTGS